VNLLYNRLYSYFPHAKFWCYTEDPKGIIEPVNIIPILKRPSLRKWWNKLALFSNEMPFEGKCLFFDLDMEIVGDPSPWINNFNTLTVVNDYYKKDLYYDKHSYDVNINSSIIAWTANEQIHVWEKFLENKDYFMRKYRGIDRFMVYEGIELYTFKDGIVNSVNNDSYDNAPVNMYNGIEYNL
jgi:hypothetical protein